MKIKPEIRERWLAALRSGDYRQGRGQLWDTEGGSGDTRYCCLGVLTDLAAQDGVLERETHEYGGCGFLPGQVVAWAGLDSDDPEVPAGFDEPSSLSSLNDDGISFDQIADLIEAGS